MAGGIPVNGIRQRLHEEIAAFAEIHAGTDLDLDEDLEQAGLEAIRIDAEELMQLEASIAPRGERRPL